LEYKPNVVALRLALRKMRGPRTELGKLQKYFQPVGKLEELLVDKLAAMLWRHRRLISMEVAELKRSKEPALFAELINSGIDDTKGLNIPVLDPLMRCETAFERTIDRILYQLERLQRMRHGQPVPPEQRVRLEL
jgi:hypothetical protein